MIDDEGLYETFWEEAKELISQAEAMALQLEQTGDTEETVHTIFRCIHTLKGNSAAFALVDITSLAHELESVLNQIKQQTILLSPEVIDVILSSIDTLKILLLNISTQDTIAIDKEIQALQQLTNTENDTIEETIHEHYVQQAQKENKNLLAIRYDLAQQHYTTLSEFVAKIQSGKELVLQHKLEAISALSTETIDTNGAIPTYLLLVTEEPIETLSEQWGIQIQSSKYYYRKKIQATPLAKDMPIGNQLLQERQLKVDSKLIDELMNLAGEAITAQNQLVQSLASREDFTEDNLLNRLNQITNSIYSRVLKTKLKKLNSIYPRMRRVVRETCKQLEKDVDFVLDSGDVELDRSTIDSILEALVHIIRNSIDHGIETPTVRKQKGKQEKGTVEFSATLKGGDVEIVIRDDGKGLDTEKIKIRAVEKGIVSGEQAGRMAEEEIVELIFQPGFSTKEEVSEVSGRGYGMDVVKKSFRNLGGNVKLRNASQGAGSVLLATVPQTVTVVASLLVSVFGRKYAIFQKHVIELVRIEKESDKQVYQNRVYIFRQQMIPLLHLGELLFPQEQNRERSEYLAIIALEQRRFAVLFDDLLGVQEIVVKPLGKQIKKNALFQGASILGDGDAVLVLDVHGIASQLSPMENHTPGAGEKPSNQEVQAKLEYIVFRIDEFVYAVSCANVLCVEPLEPKQIVRLPQGDEVYIRGELLPFLRPEKLFRGQWRLETAFLLSLQNESCKFAIPISEVLDVVEDTNRIEPKNRDQTNFETFLCYEDRIIPIVDCADLIVGGRGT
ncbi:MAG: chemotaxis protein CheA [Spirochaetota bacterium]